MCLVYYEAMKKFVFVFFTILYFNLSFAGVLFKPKIVSVNETADTVVNAKKKAFLKAKKTAWIDLINIVGVANRNDIINISENDMDSMIENIDVSGEKARSKRYIANITVYFNPKKIRSYFRNNNINFLEEIGFPFLVIPIYEQDGISYIYEQANIWEKALFDNPKQGGLLPIVLAEGGVRNSLNIDSSIIKNHEKIIKTSKLYGVEGVVIAKVSLIPSNSGLHMKLKYNSIGDFLENKSSEQSFKSKNTDKTKMLKYISSVFYVGLEKMWQNKIKNNKEFSLNTQIVILPTKNQQDLERLKLELSEIENIENIELISLNSGLAEFKLTFLGLLKKLKIAFERLGYIVNNEYNKWIIKLP